MKVYSYVRIDMDTGETLEESSYEYTGPVAECKGGGSSTTTTTSVDKEYNARLANIAEEQQDWAGDFKNIYQYGVDYDPTEKVTGYYDESGKFIQGKAPGPGPEEGFLAEDGTWISKDRWKEIYRKGGKNRTAEEKDYWVQGQTINRKKAWETRINPEFEQVSGTYADIYGYNPDDVTSQMELEQMQVQANADLVPLQTKQAKEETRLGTERASAMRELVPQQLAVGKKFYDKSLNGVDVNKRVKQAAADVGQAFAGAEERTRRALGGMGIDPSSGRGKSAYDKTGLNFGRSLAGARTAARTAAEDEEYNRLRTAASISSGM